MTKTAMKSMLRMAIFGGAVALSPAVALADTWTGPSGAAADEKKLDHQAAETHGDDEGAFAVPDHNAAQPATADDGNRAKGLDRVQGVPDQAEAEARGAHTPSE